MLMLFFFCSHFRLWACVLPLAASPITCSRDWRCRCFLSALALRRVFPLVFVGCVCPSRGLCTALLDPVLLASATPPLPWELWVARPDALLGRRLCVWPDALLGLSCGWGPGFGVAGVTCMLPSVVPYSLLSSVQYLLRVPCLSLAPGCCCVLE